MGKILLQEIISHAKPMGGKQVFSVTVIFECPGLANQPINYMPVLNLMVT
jgi:hypothetical protein